MPNDHDLLALLDKVQQITKVALGFKRSDFAHHTFR
jgi:hypothetical protein